MLPIFNEYIEFLKNNNINVGLEEGYFWLDRQIIKAYDANGELQKIARIFIDDKLNMTYKIYNHKKEIRVVSWQNIIEKKLKHLQQIEKESLELIKSSLSKYNQHKPFILTSGGKDSTIITHLVR